jgi:transcriptional regulator of acetoin/glycerol metabolism
MPLSAFQSRTLVADRAPVCAPEGGTAPWSNTPTAAAQPATMAVNAPTSALAPRLQDVALQTMTDALRQCRGNVSAAAKLLGVSRNTIYRKKDLLPPDVWG